MSTNNLWTHLHSEYPIYDEVGLSRVLPMHAITYSPSSPRAYHISNIIHLLKNHNSKDHLAHTYPRRKVARIPQTE